LLTLTYLKLESMGKNRTARPDDDGFTIVQGFPPVRAAVHIGVGGINPRDVSYP